MKLDIDVIEDRLSELGIETLYTGKDEGTSFAMAIGSLELEILDGVSGEYFRPEDTTEALIYRAGKYDDVTDEITSVTSVGEFIGTVERILDLV